MSAEDVERLLATHLHRAGELLRGDEIDGADAEVAAALKLRSDDVRARNLLGLVRFRGGKHEEALAIYRELVQKDPEDPALRLNLGLVELRMGRHDDAAANLERVVEKEPNNQRAQGYLGLALMRAGDLQKAREAFVKAGQEELVKQVEEKIAGSSEESDRAVAEVRRIADRGLKAFESEQPFTPVELEAPADKDKANRERGAWQLRAAGAPMPAPGPEGIGASPSEKAAAAVEPLRLEAPKTVAEFATARLLRAAKIGEPFALAEGGMLVLRIDGRLPTRTLGAIASSGQLAFEPMMRRIRGKTTSEPFGEGPEALFLTTGNGLIVVAPRGGKFTALSLKDDVVYVRESSLFAFEETLHWENGRVPGGGDGGLRVTQLRGTGRMVIRAQAASFCVKMEPEETLYVGQEVLLGWIGRVVPRQLKGTDGEPTPYIECTGEGALILEEPGPI
jgi:tetratricopeptide (TPR) repeat protein